MNNALRTFVESYSACDVCRLNNTLKCSENTPYLSRAVYFTTPFKPEDEVTFYCKNFKLNKSELKRRT